MAPGGAVYVYGDGDHVPAVASMGGTSCGYDANGNTTIRGGDTLTWDAENRLEVVGGDITTTLNRRRDDQT